MSAGLEVSNALAEEGQPINVASIADSFVSDIPSENYENAAFEVLLSKCEDVVKEEKCNIQNGVSNGGGVVTHFNREDILKNCINTPITSNPFGLSVLQNAAASSPPPHSYRHSRAYRHFKNPPQPHMCIRTTTEAGEELFINVLSWTRIVIPQEPSDPIPLYGGMRVAPGSPRSPPIVFAVMANPEVLKDSGRHSKDPEERHAMVELMCDFVEAMNPGIKLVRNAVILKDRDISGELKDVWNAVQTQRDREREEQLILQRQQQHHYHNITNVSNTGLNTPTKHLFPISVVIAEGLPPSHVKDVLSPLITDNINNVDSQCANLQKETATPPLTTILLDEQLDNNFSAVKSSKHLTADNNIISVMKEDENQKTVNLKDVDDGSKVVLEKSLHQKLNQENVQENHTTITNGINGSDMTTTTTTTNATLLPISNNDITSNPNLPLSSGTAVSPTTPAKKEKLGGFLPNGCIFPRFKSNHKHKDKDKEKEAKGKDKEKNNALLNVLKSKSKDKKSNAANNHILQQNENKQSQQKQKVMKEKSDNSTNSCLKQLACDMNKLDLNKKETTQPKSSSIGIESVGVH